MIWAITTLVIMAAGLALVVEVAALAIDKAMRR